MVPLVYYFALFGDCCVAIYCFCSGYGLLISYKKNKENYCKNNLIRIFKLYINFWIILFIFVVVLGWLLGQADKYPGDLKTFILNFTAISTSYNGAWWFLTTYIILVLLSPRINKVGTKHNYITVILLSIIFYIVAYIQRIKGIIVVDNSIIDWGIRQVALLGTSQLPFIVGSIFAEKNLYSKLYNIAEKIKYKNVVGILLIVMMIVAHGIVQTLFVAVFTGIAFICIFNLMDKPKWLEKLLGYISNHSTNMWLTHMFFYMIFFKELVFAPKYSFIIFPWLVILCLGTSYVINLIYKPIDNWVSSMKLYNNKLNVIN